MLCGTHNVVTYKTLSARKPTVECRVPCLKNPNRKSCDGWSVVIWVSSQTSLSEAELLGMSLKNLIPKQKPLPYLGGFSETTDTCFSRMVRLQNSSPRQRLRNAPILCLQHFLSLWSEQTEGSTNLASIARIKNQFWRMALFHGRMVLGDNCRQNFETIQTGCPFTDLMSAAIG